MPRCLGGFENSIHISDVDFIVEGENPAIGELGGGGAATEIDQAVAKLIVDEIPMVHVSSLVSEECQMLLVP